VWKPDIEHCVECGYNGRQYGRPKCHARPTDVAGGEPPPKDPNPPPLDCDVSSYVSAGHGKPAWCPWTTGEEVPQ
jgi:hypothetical protein